MVVQTRQRLQATPRRANRRADQLAPAVLLTSAAPAAARTIDDVLGSTLARAAATRACAGRRVLARRYYLYDMSEDDMVEITDPAEELDALTKAVNSYAALADIRAAWKAQSRSTLISTLYRMMDPDERGTYSGLVMEALGSHSYTKVWAFANREHAARSVLGESHRASAEATERVLANQVFARDVTASSIARDVGTFAKKVLGWIKHNVDTGKVAGSVFDKTQRYGYYYNPITLWGSYAVGPRKALQTATATSEPDVVKAIAAITDVCSAVYKLGDAGEAFISVSADKAKASSPGAVEDIESIRDSDAGMMDETSASMKHARSHNMMVDHGPSYTTGRLLKLGTHIGATDREQTAVALALFAFWNVHYWRSASGIHHFHYVMDMLNNFVPGRYKYQGYPAHISDVYDFDNVPKVAVKEEKERDVVLT